MHEKMKGFASLFLLAFALLDPAAGSQSGITETVFNRRFIPTVRPMMTYEQIVRLAGGPGLRIGEDKKTVPPTIQYRWLGGRDSALTAKFGNNRLVEAIVLAPNKHTYLIRSNGEVVDTKDLQK